MAKIRGKIQGISPKSKIARKKAAKHLRAKPQGKTTHKKYPQKSTPRLAGCFTISGG